jgi:formylglycine-generating enzyme required for sulfatase activity
VVTVAYALKAGTAEHADTLDGLDAAAILARLHAIEGRFWPEPAMCTVPAGRFICSNPPGGGALPTTAGTSVYLSAYQIGKHEITNAQYCHFLNAGGNDDHWHASNAEIIKLGLGSYLVVEGFKQRPVRWVAWGDCVAFCDWLSDHEGLEAPYHYRLPTEAEWEKAAGWGPNKRPDTDRLWYYGMASDTIDCDSANHAARCVGGPTDVGSYLPNAYGCHDMSGNLYEWCADWHAPEGYPSGTVNPAGPLTGTDRLYVAAVGAPARGAAA